MHLKYPSPVLSVPRTPQLSQESTLVPPPDHSWIFPENWSSQGYPAAFIHRWYTALAGLIWDMALQGDTGYLLVLTLHPPFVFINVLGHDSLVQTFSLHAWPCLPALFWFCFLKTSLLASFRRIRILFTKQLPLDNLGHFQLANFRPICSLENKNIMFTYSPAHGGSVPQHYHFLGLLTVLVYFPLCSSSPVLQRERRDLWDWNCPYNTSTPMLSLSRWRTEAPQSRCESGLLNYLFYRICVESFQNSRSRARITVHCVK